MAAFDLIALAQLHAKRHCFRLARSTDVRVDSRNGSASQDESPGANRDAVLDVEDDQSRFDWTNRVVRVGGPTIDPASHHVRLPTAPLGARKLTGTPFVKTAAGVRPIHRRIPSRRIRRGRNLFIRT